MPSRLAVLVGLGIALASCAGEGSTPPGALRFGQLGSIQVQLQVPLHLGSGELDQTLTWASGGQWTLKEAISYKGLLGDETMLHNPGSPAQFASDYASLILALNDQPGLQLDVPELPQDSIPTCGPALTRVTVTIHDDPRNQDKSWTRCANGSLGSLSTQGAGPGAAAARVAVAAQLARNSTVSDTFVSVYSGSVPFGTLDKGEDTPARLTAPMAITDQGAWAAFWHEQTAGTGYPPTVDFSREMVIVAADGTRSEAGDSIEVHRILQVNQGTIVHIWERVPGDFCSPVARVHTPYHIVVAPLTALPIQFADIHTEKVPCGTQGG